MKQNQEPFKGYLGSMFKWALDELTKIDEQLSRNIQVIERLIADNSYQEIPKTIKQESVKDSMFELESGK